MQDYIKQLKAYLTNTTLNYGDPDITTMLDFLWTAYTQENPTYNEAIRQGFLAMEPVFETLSLEDADNLLRVVCSVCLEHERLAFLSGLHVGAALEKELT